MTKELIESIKPKKIETVDKIILPRWITGPIYPKPTIWVSKKTLKKKKK